MTVCKEISMGCSSWYRTFKTNVDWDNCSSNSLLFYVMLLTSGTFEMFMSFCLFFDFKIIENSKKNIEPYSVNLLIFAIGVSIEALYWFITRIYLAKTYIKHLGNRNSTIYNISVILLQSIVSILPCEMLIFFGYTGNHSYEKRLLNFTWLRRLVSVLRIIL